METIETQRKTIARLEATVERLTAKVAELERRQNRNSGTSSLPPFSDTFVRPDKKPPPVSGRKRGRQPGAPGSGLAMVENPDEVEDHVPAGCGGCGQLLSTEDRAHRCWCGGCGAVTSADLPARSREHRRRTGRTCARAAYLLVGSVGELQQRL